TSKELAALVTKVPEKGTEPRASIVTCGGDVCGTGNVCVIVSPFGKVEGICACAGPLDKPRATMETARRRAPHQTPAPFPFNVLVRNFTDRVGIPPLPDYCIRQSREANVNFLPMVL